MLSSSIKRILLPVVGMAVSIAPQALPAQLSANAIVAPGTTGLESPRGLRFGPDGDLYVAEAGPGGPNSGAGCAQVPAPVGPYKGGLTARISKFEKVGNTWVRSTVADGLPSAVGGMGQTLGVADLEFMNGTLYALISGGGCSHGNVLPNGVVSVDIHSGNWRYVADISEFMSKNPVQYPNPGDFEPDGTTYSMIGVNGDLYAVEANWGQLLRIDPWSGRITRQIDTSASQGHYVPTSVAYNNGKFLLGNLNLFPIEPHTSRVVTLSRSDGGFAAPGLDVPGPFYVSASKAGFATIVSLEIGPDGLLYVLQLAPGTPNEMPAPGFGKVTRINRDGSLTDVVTGLSLPTGMTFGRDGKLYISNWGAAGPGPGQIVVATVP